MIKENEKGLKIVGIVKDEEHLQKVINDLQIAGFDRAALGVLDQLENKDEKNYNLKPIKKRWRVNIAPEEVGIGEGVILGLAVIIGVVIALLTSSSIVSDEAIILAFVYGLTFLALGFFLIHFLDNLRIKSLKAQVKKGGVALYVKIRDKSMEKSAIEILNRRNAKDVKRIFAPL